MRLLAVDGPSGAGKTTVAADLAARLRADGLTVAVVPCDHLASWADPVAWWPRLVSGVLAPLRAGRPGGYRRADWFGGVPTPGEWLTVPVPDVLVVEGVSAGRVSVRPSLTLLAWVDLPDAEQRLARSVARDGAADLPHLVAWQRFERGWFAVDGTRAAASVVLRSTV